MGLWEALTTTGVYAEEVRSSLLVAHATKYVCGVTNMEEQLGGWQRPKRFLPEQELALTSCVANHPGLFRQMAATTAGVCLRFATDATEVAVAVRMDDEPRRTAVILSPVDDGGPRGAHDGISCEVDGKSRGCAMPRTIARSLPWLEGTPDLGLACFDLRESGTTSTAGMMSLPGLGKRREVCLWLPCLRGCTIRELWLDGTYIEPLSGRSRLLVLGDSIGQGFCSDAPANAWSAILSNRLDRELLNQSVGGQVFQVSALPVLELGPSDFVVVELGSNYRWDPLPASVLKREIESYLSEVKRRWPVTPIWVTTPLWHDELMRPSRSLACVEEATRTILTVSRELDLATVAGERLVDGEASFFIDGEHPNAKGHRQLAGRLGTIIRKALRKRTCGRHIGKEARYDGQGASESAGIGESLGTTADGRTIG